MMNKIIPKKLGRIKFYAGLQLGPYKINKIKQFIYVLNFEKLKSNLKKNEHFRLIIS